MEKQDLASSALASDAAAAKTKLQSALDQFKEARPAALDQQFRNSGAGKNKPEKKGKKKAERARRTQ